MSTGSILFREYLQTNTDTDLSSLDKQDIDEQKSSIV